MTFQVEEKEESPIEEPNESEASNFSDIEFQVMCR